MIYFNINIRNPQWWNRFENLWNKTGKTFVKHKYWEIEVIKCPELFRIEFELSTRQDHAGINLELGLAGYAVHFTIYDSRHWNYINNQWEIR